MLPESYIHRVRCFGQTMKQASWHQQV